MKKTKVSTTTDVADIQQSPVAVALGAIYYSVGKTLIGAVSGESAMDYAVYGTIEKWDNEDVYVRASDDTRIVIDIESMVAALCDRALIILDEDAKINFNWCDADCECCDKFSA